jgi:hypothetical protein
VLYYTNIIEEKEIQMTEDQMIELARGNIERHLYIEEGDEDSIFDEAYTLAFGALADVGVSLIDARRVASKVAQLFAQP